MKLVVYPKIYFFVQYLPLFFISIALLGINEQSILYTRRVTAANPQSICPSAMNPTEQSLLVVIVSRSNSFVTNSTSTSPNLYDTSVTKALADIWPGDMAVIPFGANREQTFGPAVLSDLRQRETLKKNLQDYPTSPNVYTSLDSALRSAFDLLTKQGNPPGSRIIIIADGKSIASGSDDSLHQTQDIRQNLLPQFCNQGIPLATFGLTSDASTPTGQDTNQLLTDIAHDTDTSYSNITGPEDLPKEVLALVSQWLHVTFTSLQDAGNGFQFSLDTFVQKVFIIAIRSNDKDTFLLDGPNGQPMTNGIQKSPPDPYYEIDALNASGGVTSGMYTEHVNGDQNAQVYVLVKPSLGVELITPTTKDQYHTGTTIAIQAQFVSSGIGKKEIVTPSENDHAQIIARVTLLVAGKAVGLPNDVVLTQDKTTEGKLQSAFSGATPKYEHLGQLRIELQGIFQQTEVQSSTTLNLLNSTLITTNYVSKFVVAGIVLLVLVTTIFVLYGLRIFPKRSVASTKTKTDEEVELKRILRSLPPQNTQARTSVAIRLARKVLDDLFIAREDQEKLFQGYLNRWLALLQNSPFTEPLRIPPSPDEKLQGLVVLICGGGGSGKTTLLKHYWEIALAKQQELYVSKIINWDYILGEGMSRKHVLFNRVLREHVDAPKYFALLRTQIAYALDKPLDEFKEYQAAVNTVDETKRDAMRILNDVQHQKDYSSLSGIIGEEAVALLRLIPVVGGLLNDELAKRLKEIFGESVPIVVEQVRLLSRKLTDALGSNRLGYLEPPLYLGLSLGHDIAGFARKQPLLVCFDTYEEIDEADELLRLVMGAAGPHVGWVIAGRKNLWAGQHLRKQESGYRYIVPSHLGLPVDLDDGEKGNFDLTAIKLYHSELRTRIASDMSLPALSDTEAELILKMTRGVPLAVKIVADLFVEKSDISFVIGREEIKREVIDRVVRWYLRHTDTRPEDRAKLYGLALVRNPMNMNKLTIMAALDLPSAANYESDLSQSHRQLGFVFMEQKYPTLHKDVRYFLRLWLLENRDDYWVNKANGRLKNAFHKDLVDMEMQQPGGMSNRARLEDDKWVERFLDLADQTFWLNPNIGIQLLLPFIVLASIYQRDIHPEAFKIGEFFEKDINAVYLKDWQAAKQSFLLDTSLNPSSNAVKGLEYLSMRIEQESIISSQPLTPSQDELRTAIRLCLQRLRGKQVDEADYEYKESS